MAARSEHITYNATAQRYLTALDEVPNDGDVFIWSDQRGLEKQPPLKVLLPIGMSRPVTATPLPGPMFDPGLLAPEESVDSLVAKFPLIEHARAALRKHEGFDRSPSLTAVEYAVFNQAVNCLRICTDTLREIAGSMEKQRNQQRRFNDAYAQLTELVEQCPAPFA